MAQCNVTKTQFRHQAPLHIVCKVGDRVVDADRKEFGTGSFGWNYSGKIWMELEDGTKVQCQVGLNITVIGSKEAQP